MILGVGLLLPVVAVALAIGSGLVSQLTPVFQVIGLLLLASGGLLFLAGLVLFVALPSLSPERACRNYASHWTVMAMLGLAVVIANAISAVHLVLTGGVGFALDRPTFTLSPINLAVSIAALEVALLVVLYVRIVRPGIIGWRDMGFTTRSLGRSVLLGVLSSIVLLLIVAGLELVLRRLGIEQTQAMMFDGIRDASPTEFGLLLLAGAGLAPLAEEAFFRGYVFQAYQQAKGVWRAYLYSAGLFAVVHLNLPALLPIFVIGLGFAFVYRRTGSIVPAVVAHGVNNLVALSALYFALPG